MTLYNLASKADTFESEKRHLILHKQEQQAYTRTVLGKLGY